MVAFILHIRQTEILESLIVDFPDILEPFCQCFAVRASRQVDINHGKGCIIEVEPDSNTAFVASNT